MHLVKTSFYGATLLERSAEKMFVEDDNIDLFPAHVTLSYKNRHKKV